METTTERTERLSPLKQAFLALERAQARLDELKRTRTEPIAIVGIGCRMPGGCDDPRSFWQLLRDGAETVTEVPRDRWNIDDYYDPNPDASGKMYTRCGNFVSHVDQFDPDFFGIAPREAATIDPQHRLLLETAWEGLEHAGMAPESLYNSSTGVFLGICNFDYSYLLDADAAEVEAYFGTGNSGSGAAGRLSYHLGLQGPCLAVDTACSSSLVAVHLACQSLRNRECDLALGCGVNLMLAPKISVIFARNRMLSADGRCKTFDAAADGYGRGEGVGVIVLKRLSDALADGDRITAVIRSSAINQDGPSGGLTVPNGPAQQDVIRRALAAGEVDPAEVTYIEAHGTGTSLGDPIEVGALGAVFGRARSKQPPLLLGAVKANIGHLEGAAGVAGLIKVALMLKHNEIAPHPSFQTPNPRIAWDELPIEVVTRRQPWAEGRPRVAGVSSFGFTGTNAHIVLEAAPQVPLAACQPVSRTPHDDGNSQRESPLRSAHLLVLSAKSTTSLDQLAARHADHLAAQADLPLADVAYTLGTGRSHFPERLAVLAGSTAEAAERLAECRSRRSTAGIVRGRADRPPAKVAFLFTGQGSQYVGMGRELYQTQPVFRAVLDHCDEVLRDWLDRPLLEILYPPAGVQAPIDETAYTQPALFALEYALAQVWQSWGIVPTAVMGHSLGESVAACVAGVFSLEDGLKLVAERGRLMQALPRGTMVAVLADHQRVAAAVEPYRDDVSIAAINGPAQVVVSGRGDAMASLVDQLQQAGVRTMELGVSHAFHSPLVEPMVDAFRRVAETVHYSPPRWNVISNLTGRREREDVASADYWCNHICNPVRFAQGVAALAEAGINVLLEVGPQPTLLGLARRCLSENESFASADVAWLPSLRSGQSDWQTMLTSLAELYVRGSTIHWASVAEGQQCRKVELPSYPFQRQRCWFDASAAPASSGHVSADTTGHPLLGDRLHSAARPIQFQAELRAEQPDFLQDHRLGGLPILPASVYLEVAMAAAEQVVPDPAKRAVEIRDVSLEQMLPLPAGRPQTVQTIVTPTDETDFRFEFYRMDTAAHGPPAWQLHASATLAAAERDEPPKRVDLADVQRRCSQRVDRDEFYRTFGQLGLDYGPRFRTVGQVWRCPGEALAEVSLPAEVRDGADHYHLHPVLLDGCIQALAAAFAGERTTTFLPIGADRVAVEDRLPERLFSHVRLRASDTSTETVVTADVELLGSDGTRLATINGLRLKQVHLDAEEFANRWASELDTSAPGTHAGTEARPQSSVAAAAVAEKLKTASGSRRRGLMVEYLQEETAAILRRGDGNRPDPNRTFLELGMDSLTGLELIYRIRGGIGVVLPAEMLLYHATIAQLADELMKRLEDQDADAPVSSGESGWLVDELFADPEETPGTPWLVLPKPSQEARLRLFCFHHLGGGASLYRGWSDDTAPEIELCAVQLPGREERAGEPPITDFPTLVEAVVDVLPDYLDRPFAFFGHSGGSLIGYELAQLVRQRLGLSPECFFVGAMWAPRTVMAHTRCDPVKLVRLLKLADPHGTSPADASEVVMPPAAVAADVDLFAGYRYTERPPLDCPIVAFGGSEDELVPRDDLLAWSEHTRDSFRLEIRPGTHHSYLNDRRHLLETIAGELL